MHKTVKIKNLSLYFADKLCFENFSADLHGGDRIAIIGRNGSGKTCLIKILAGLMDPAEGEIIKDKDITVGYVPQIVTDYGSLSGGERFNKALTEALALRPDILLLDEPTNHLDRRNRNSLMQMLRRYPGTLVIVSHDTELLNSSINTLWHIENGEIQTFTGNFTDYISEMKMQRASLENELSLLEKEKKNAHKSLMKEQQRAKKSRLQGENAAAKGKWAPIIAGGMKRRAQLTAGSKKKDIRNKTEDINSRIQSFYIPEIIAPKFSLETADIDRGTILSVTDGAAGYENMILKDINFSLTGTGRMSITGDNGSGKTTLIRALMSDPSVKRTGDWLTPKKEDIGYLDQHYSTLDPQKTVLETIKDALPSYTHAELRDFLNDFLFRKQEEVTASVRTLSGGEKARLSLALIAAKTPRLLILDEVTNNIDFETREHIINVIKEYPAALIVISHEQNFLDSINIERDYNLN